jgi:acyl carrier protein
MMNSGMHTVEQRVRQIIVDRLGIDADCVTPQSDFAEDLGADSLDRVELLLAMEEKFRVRVPEGETDRIRTVQDAVAYIEKNSRTLVH